jgi:hypothetical protein
MTVKEIGSASATGLTFSSLGALLSVRYYFSKCRITFYSVKSRPCGVARRIDTAPPEVLNARVASLMGDQRQVREWATGSETASCWRVLSAL